LCGFRSAAEYERPAVCRIDFLTAPAHTHNARTLVQFLPLCHPHKHTDEDWDIPYREIQISYA